MPDNVIVCSIGWLLLCYVVERLAGSTHSGCCDRFRARRHGYRLVPDVEQRRTRGLRDRRLAFVVICACTVLVHCAIETFLAAVKWSKVSRLFQ